jgi:hypothetical protein
MDKSKGILVFFIIVFWLDSLLDYEQISIFINLNNDKKRKMLVCFVHESMSGHYTRFWATHAAS